MQPEEARALLQESAAIPAPPTRVSVSAAADRGRRIVRTRQILTGTAAGVVALAIAGAAPAALSQPQRPPDVIAASPELSSAPGSEANAPAKEWSPLTRTVAVGWVPEGLVQMFAISSRSQYRVSYHYPAAQGQSIEEAVSVTVHDPKGQASRQQQGPTFGPPPIQDPPPTTEAPAVNGSPARWIQPPDAPPSFARLRWDYRPNAWAEVTVHQVRGGQDPKQVAHRIASGVTMDITAPIRLPFQLSGVPSSLPVSLVAVNEKANDVPWSVEVDFGDYASRAWPLTVSVSGKHNCGECGGKFEVRQNTTVQGMPAWRETTEQRDSLTVYAPNGIIFNIIANPGAVKDKLGPDGVVRLAEQLTLLGEPENWTDQPLR